ncbi:hypothetical protein Arub01_59330 [Actinomadura rubrobrunea]|uniref:Uncharacterized protein n=1 Tax=Actinomadura rubrobrunea TaxID=115335 RepID=A0A9W6Q0F1_9ACTN|nr:hypothetical protein [Actinomadura rubrobrunea]GLW67690.1 hypothetical protein Arub01_59330 [Actinomadura rubrobrunea]
MSSTTLDRTAQPVTRDPRELISDELFDQIVARIQEHMPVARFYAELMVEQMLAYIATVAAYDPGNPPAFVVDGGYEFRYLTPSTAVDPAIHYFLDFTGDYRAFCARLTGGHFIDHVPVVNESITSGKSLRLTVDVMRHFGWEVDERMWQQGTSCCQTDNCFLKVTRLN